MYKIWLSLVQEEKFSFGVGGAVRDGAGRGAGFGLGVMGYIDFNRSKSKRYRASLGASLIGGEKKYFDRFFNEINY